MPGFNIVESSCINLVVNWVEQRKQEILQWSSFQLKQWFSNIKPRYHVYFLRVPVVHQRIIYNFVQLLTLEVLLSQQSFQWIRRRKLGFVVLVQVPDALSVYLRQTLLHYPECLQSSALRDHIFETHERLPSLDSAHNYQLQEVLRAVLIVLPASWEHFGVVLEVYSVNFILKFFFKVLLLKLDLVFRFAALQP